MSIHQSLLAVKGEANMRILQAIRSRSLRTAVRAFMLPLISCVFLSVPGFALKPKVHMYLGLKLIQDLSRSDLIQLPGFVGPDWPSFPTDPELLNAVRKWPGYFLAGTIGPDGFPDIIFGQAVIHPDLRCDYNNPSCPYCNCELGPESRTWTGDWLKHLWDRAHELSGAEREQALAFVLGFFSHAAGDMWGHTFVNQYAGGSWPVDYTSDIERSAKNIERHLITEGVVGNHVPDIRAAVDGVHNADGPPGIRVPMKFLYDTFITDDWTIDHRGMSLISMFMTFKKALQDHALPDEPQVSDDEIAVLLSGEPIASAAMATYLLPKAKDWVVRHYVLCWISNIDEGLSTWLETSASLADQLFVKGETDHVSDTLNDFKNDYLWKMLGLNPQKMIETCLGIPRWVVFLVNPGQFLVDTSDEIIESVTDWAKAFYKEIQEDIVNFVFNKAFGISFDEFKDYWTNAETLAPVTLGPSVTAEILDLLYLDSSGFLDDGQCAPIHNVDVLNHMLLLNVDGLNALMFRFNVGPVFQPETSPNVMLGFMKSIDGNHQWRRNAPGPPIAEPRRSFGTGMSLWVNRLARQNFFSKVFKDWTTKGHTMVAGYPEQITETPGLPPVSTRFRLLTNHDRCTPSFAEVTLTNHQSVEQPYAVYVTVEDPRNDRPMATVCDNKHNLEPIPRETYSPVHIMPEDTFDESVFFHKVERGILPAAPVTCTDKVLLIQLPNCYSVDDLIKVYILREIATARPEILETNPIIPKNPREFLNEDVVSYYEASYQISCEDCTPPPCDLDRMTVVYTATWGKPARSEQVTITVPCDQACYRGTKDADDDGRDNEFDNCPLTPNPQQEDCDGDRIGDACKPCVNPGRGGRERIGPVLPDFARWERIFHDLLDQGIIGPVTLDRVRPPLPPGDGWPVLIEGSIVGPIAQSMDNYVNRWRSGGIPDAKFYRSIHLLLCGLYYQSAGIRIEKATFTRGEREGVFDGQNPGCLMLMISPRGAEKAQTTAGRTGVDVQIGRIGRRLEGAKPADGGESLSISIPRILLDSRTSRKDAAYRILASGKDVPYTEQKSEEFRTLSMEIAPGTRTIEIFGNNPGPGSAASPEKAPRKVQPEKRIPRNTAPEIRRSATGASADFVFTPNFLDLTSGAGEAFVTVTSKNWTLAHDQGSQTGIIIINNKTGERSVLSIRATLGGKPTGPDKITIRAVPPEAEAKTGPAAAKPGPAVKQRVKPRVVEPSGKPAVSPGTLRIGIRVAPGAEVGKEYLLLFEFGNQSMPILREAFRIQVGRSF